MKKLLFLFLLWPIFVLGQEKEPILKLDTGGHMGSINDIVRIGDGRYFVTCSDDKTIRVWDSETGKEDRRILGQIGPGSEGMIFAIAVSPDAKYLAAGGFMEAGKGPECNYIRIHELATGKLLHLLKAHTDVVTDLAFSPDGKYLASSSTDNTVALWRVDGFTLARVFRNHAKQVYGVAFYGTGNQMRLVSAGYDNRLYFNPLDGSKKAESFTHTNKLQYIATSADRIAACGYEDNAIKIFNSSLKNTQTVQEGGVHAGLAFSPDSRLLLAGSLAPPYHCSVFNAERRVSRMVDFDGHDAPVRAVAFLDNKTAVTAGGDNHDIYTWDVRTGKEDLHLTGDGRQVWSVGVHGKSIAFGDHKPSGSTAGYEAIFHLEDFLFTSPQETESIGSYRPLPVQNPDYSLSAEKGGDSGYMDAVLVIKGKDGSRAKIIRGATDGYRHRAYGLTGEGIVISGGNQGQLQAYDILGHKICDLVGHTGDILSLSSEGEWLVSGGGDQTIRLWNIDEMKRSKSVEPTLNIFISREKEWVVWSRNGYYNASVGGDRYIGYHVNQGRDKEAVFYRSDRFFAVYFRPDIIASIVRSGSEGGTLASGGKTKEDEYDVANILPPLVQVNSPTQEEITTKAEEITIDFTVIPQSEHPVTEIAILVNGRPLSERGMQQSRKRSGIQVVKSVPLSEVDNTITLYARNQYAQSNPVSLHVIREEGVEALYKPSLYILSVGVSKYQNPSYDLDYAAADARSIVDVFKAQEGKLYGQMHTKLLLDQEATKEEILGGIDWLDREVTQRDVAVIFIAGHGINDDYGNFYFLSHEADEDQLRRTAVKWVEFEDIIKNLPSKVILMADACHSGNIMGGKRRSVGDFNAAVKSIIAAGTGQIIMTATTGNAVSIEDPEWGHGAFTKALIEGLQEGKADYDGDKSVSLKEIDLYVTVRVKALTDGRQKPTTIIPESIPDFAVTAQ